MGTSRDQWRDPDDYFEPLTGVPHAKLRIGQFRLGADCTDDEKFWISTPSNAVVVRTNPVTIDFPGRH